MLWYSNEKFEKAIDFLFVCILLAGFVPSNFAKAEEISSKLKGRILLQVESHGEAWYVRMKDLKRYYMKDGAAAYSIMRFFSLWNYRRGSRDNPTSF